MSVIQLSAESDKTRKDRRPLVAAPAARPGQVTVNLIIPTLNEPKNLAHVLPVVPVMADERVTTDSGSTRSAAA
jgi:hypothetical protein